MRLDADCPKSSGYPMKNYIKDNISLESLSTLFVQAPVALAFLKGENFIIEAANPQILEVWDKTNEIIGLPLLQAISELEGQIFIDMLKHVLQTGETYNGSKASVLLNRDGKAREFFFDFIYAPIFDEDDRTITGVSVVATDVTEQVLAQKRLEESDFRYEELLSTSDFSTAVYTGRDLIVDFANDEMLKTWGKDATVRGKKLADALPELRDQPFLEILQNIFDTGVGYSAAEDRVDLEVDGELKTFYFNFSYKPLKDKNGKVYAILNNAFDVTEIVESRKKITESEKLLKTFVENVPMAVSVMAGPEYRILISNATTAKTWGGKPGRIGLTIKEAYPGIENQEPYRALEEVRTTGKEIIGREYQIDLPHGKKFVNFILHPLKDEAGEVTHIISIAYDVTEDKLKKSKLEENEKRFRLLADTMPQVVWTADPQGNTDFYNDQWYRYSGFSKDEENESMWQELVNPEHLETVNQVWDDSVRNGTPYQIEYQLKDPNKPGDFRWFLARAVPVKDSEGNILQWVGTSTDIDDFKQLQEQKDNFLGITSHELKTPLTSLKLYSQFIEKNLRNMGDEKNADIARKMDKQINKLTTLISDLLDVTKIQNGKLQLSKSVFDVDKLAEDVIEEQQMNSRHRIFLDRSTAGEIYGDPHRIAQVMTNLIGNAIKYSPDADEIHIKLSRNKDVVSFCVRDFGIGIPADKRDKVFEQYYRVSGDKEHTFPGMGLGLYISSEIIKRSGGKIYVNSVEGKGTEFCFEIPAH